MKEDINKLMKEKKPISIIDPNKHKEIAQQLADECEKIKAPYFIIVADPRSDNDLYVVLQ